MLTGYEGQQTTDSSLLMQTAATPINMTCATPTLLVLLHTPVSTVDCLPDRGRSPCLSSFRTTPYLGQDGPGVDFQPHRLRSFHCELSYRS